MKVSVSINDGGQDYKLWGKAVSGIDLDKQGGYALLGDFVGAVPESTVNDHRYTLSADLPDGTPFVIACTFMEKGTSKDRDRVCFLVVPNSKHSAAAQYTADAHEVNINGDISVIGYHGARNDTVITQNPQGIVTNNPYYWAARHISEASNLYSKMIKEDTTKNADKPLTMYGRRSAKVDGKTITMPPGYELTEDMGGTGIWLIACVVPGKKSLQFGDIFANHHGEDEDLAWFLKQQAGLLRALAMTYEIIAIAKSGKEL